MKKYRLCYGDNGKIVYDSDDIVKVFAEKEYNQKIDAINNEKHEYIIFDETGKTIKKEWHKSLLR